MKLLFIDDSTQHDQKDKHKEYLGWGGFCIDAENIKELNNEFYTIREHYGIPHNVELKWSPGKKHFFRENIEIKHSRQKLFKDILSLLLKYNTTIICAVHDINECYAKKYYNWDTNKTRLWASEQQYKYIIERIEKPYLEENHDIGLIIADHYSDSKNELNLLNKSKFYIEEGTEYQKFNRICLCPLTTSSKNSSFIQISDLVIGITVGCLANNKYALELFDDIALLFLKNPYKDDKQFVSTISGATLGIGLILFPRKFKGKGMELFNKVDEMYFYTEKGIEKKK